MSLSEDTDGNHQHAGTCSVVLRPLVLLGPAMNSEGLDIWGGVDCIGAVTKVWGCGGPCVDGGGGERGSGAALIGRGVGVGVGDLDASLGVVLVSGLWLGVRNRGGWESGGVWASGGVPSGGDWGLSVTSQDRQQDSACPPGGGACRILVPSAGCTGGLPPKEGGGGRGGGGSAPPGEGRVRGGRALPGVGRGGLGVGGKKKKKKRNREKGKRLRYLGRRDGHRLRN